MLKIEFRGNDKVHVSGYVNATERFSRPIRSPDGRLFVEKISSGAFNRAIDRASDIEVMLNHEKPLTTVKDGEIILREDDVGLFFDGDITDPEVVRSAREKKLVGWSFGFRAIKSEESESERKGIDFERTVCDLDLLEVSLIDRRKRPCYQATSIFTRADGDEQLEVRADEACEYVENSSVEKEKIELRKRRLDLKRK